MTCKITAVKILGESYIVPACRCAYLFYVYQAVSVKTKLFVYNIYPDVYLKFVCLKIYECVNLLITFKTTDVIILENVTGYHHVLTYFMFNKLLEC